MTTTNIAMIVCYALLALGGAVAFGVFDRIGPIETPRGMTRLAWALFAAALAVGLSQSTWNPPEPAGNAGTAATTATR